MLCRRYSLMLFMLLSFGNLQAGEARIAVASNFTAVAKVLAADFGKRSGHQLHLSFGSTGKLYAQIYNGAPYDVFLAADAQRPIRAEQEGLAILNSRFTYALGKLALWSGKPISGTSLTQYLQQGDYRRIAVANPNIAPYGVASLEVIEGFGLSKLRAKMVYGENITQAYQFVASGNAELGFVALAQLLSVSDDSFWPVPEHLHEPLRQQAVLLTSGQGSAAAQAFLSYLKKQDAQAIIRNHGYGSELAL